MQTLDALAFATLPEDLLVIKLAVRFREDNKDVLGFGADAVLEWAKKSFGPVLADGSEDRLAHSIMNEVRRQNQVAARRQRGAVDPLEYHRHPNLRRFALVRSILGHAGRHVSRKILGTPRSSLGYSQTKISKGLVIGLITTNELGGGKCLLVYRAPRGRLVQVHWVPPVTTIEQALEWLYEPMQERAKQGCQVEVDWRKSRFRVRYPGGRTTTVPFRRAA